MSCGRYEGDLIEAATGIPPSPDLEHHLVLCATCRSRLEGEGRLISGAERVLRGALRVEPSGGFEARLIEAVRQGPAASRRVSWRSPRWATAWAAGLGLLLVGGWLWRTSWSAPSPRQTASARPTAPGERTAGIEPTIAARRASPEPAVPEPAQPTAALPHHVASARTSPREPEVLVSPGREEALAKFVSMLRDPRVVPPKALTELTDPQALLPELEPLEIPELQPEKPSQTVPRDARSES